MPQDVQAHPCSVRKKQRQRRQHQCNSAATVMCCRQVLLTRWCAWQGCVLPGLHSCCCCATAPMSPGVAGCPGPGDSTMCWNAPAAASCCSCSRSTASLWYTRGSTAGTVPGLCQLLQAPARPHGAANCRPRTSIHFCKDLVQVVAVAVVVINQQGPGNSCCKGLVSAAATARARASAPPCSTGPRCAQPSCSTRAPGQHLDASTGLWPRHQEHVPTAYSAVCDCARRTGQHCIMHCVASTHVHGSGGRRPVQRTFKHFAGGGA